MKKFKLMALVASIAGAMTMLACGDKDGEDSGSEEATSEATDEGGEEQ